MLRDELKSLIEAAVDRLIQAGKLPEAVREVPVEISDTRSPEHGDYACNLALAAAKKAGLPPRAVGEMLRAELLGFGDRGTEDAESSNAFSAIDVAGPGFINLKLNPAYVASFVEGVLAKGIAFANPVNPTPQRINVEFVSVNPNGPITVGSGRGAAFGSTLCNVLAAAGNTVHREYYINDGVNSEQMRLFAESVRAILLGVPLPEKGYKGEYVHEVAQQVRRDLDPKRLSQKVQGYASGEFAYKGSGAIDKAFRKRMQGIYASILEKTALHQAFDAMVTSLTTEELQRLSEFYMTTVQGLALASFGVEFDEWFSEQSLHDAGVVERCIELLTMKGVADEEPYRTVLKMARNGKVEEANREEQSGLVTEADEVPGHEAVPSQDAPEAQDGRATLWLRSTKFGDDMDRVLRRKDGRLTYIASDVAYHTDKLNRPAPGADKLITILGPDHHGYIARLQAVFAALLESPKAQRTNAPTPLSDTEAKIYRSVEERDTCLAALEEARRRLEVVIFQIVRFVKDGKPAPMRKRDGNIYELRDLITELGKNIAPNGSEEEQQTIGRDVSRFFYLMRSHDTSMDFDIDLATKQSDENPVFYAQYAHARICSVLRKADEALGVGRQASGLKWALLEHPRETALIKKILDLPMEVERSAKDYGVHRLTSYAVELARAFHHFYDACRVIQTDEPELTEARLALCQATRVALQATFKLLEVSAPEKMERDLGLQPEAS